MTTDEVIMKLESGAQDVESGAPDAATDLLGAAEIDQAEIAAAVQAASSVSVDVVQGDDLNDITAAALAATVLPDDPGKPRAETETSPRKKRGREKLAETADGPEHDEKAQEDEANKRARGAEPGDVVVGVPPDPAILPPVDGTVVAGATANAASVDVPSANNGASHEEQLAARRLKDRQRYANMTVEQRQVYNSKRREQYHRQSESSRQRRRQRERNRYHSLDEGAAKERNARRAKLERERYQRLSPADLEAKNRKRRERAALLRQKKEMEKAIAAAEAEAGGVVAPAVAAPVEAPPMPPMEHAQAPVPVEANTKSIEEAAAEAAAVAASTTLPSGVMESLEV